MEDKLRDGRKHRELGRFNLARRDAVAALVIDPVNAEALALRTECDKELAARRASVPSVLPPATARPPRGNSEDFEDAATTVAPMFFDDDDDDVVASTGGPPADGGNSQPQPPQQWPVIGAPQPSAPSRPAAEQTQPVEPLPPPYPAHIATPLPSGQVVMVPVNYQTPMPGVPIIPSGYQTPLPGQLPFSPQTPFPGSFSVTGQVSPAADRMPWLWITATAVIMASGVALGWFLFSRSDSPDGGARPPPTAPSPAAGGGAGGTVPTKPVPVQPPPTAGDAGPATPAGADCPDAPDAPFDPVTKKRICPPYARPVVYFSPHPDDETLTMGGGIIEELADGRPVYIELLTHGNDSPVRETLADNKTHRWHPGAHEYKLSPEQIGNSRVLEFLDSAARMGVTGVYISDFVDGGLTQDNVTTRIKWWLANGADGVSLRGTYTGHPDHEATWKALVASRPKDLRGFSYESEHHTRVVDIRKWCDKKSAALEGYEIWNPTADRYAIGRHSVGEAFSDVRVDCNEYVVEP